MKGNAAGLQSLKNLEESFPLQPLNLTCLCDTNIARHDTKYLTK